jgi:uncharacterized membrane protein
VNPLGAFHFLSAIVALLAGAIVLLRRKGTRFHRRAGWTYAIAMLLVNVSAMMIYRLTGSFGPFHIAALVSLATLVAGIVTARLRRREPRMVEAHYFLMGFSYVGLLAAAAAETITRVEGLSFWGGVIGATIAVNGVGALVVFGRAPATLAPFRRAYIKGR